MTHLKLSRRTFIGALATSPLALALPNAYSQSADNSIQLIYPFSPGSSAEVAVRLVAQEISSTMNRSIYVHARPGAGGIIGYTAAIRNGANNATLT